MLGHRLQADATIQLVNMCAMPYLIAGCSSAGLTTATAMPILHLCFGSLAVQLAAITGLITAIGGMHTTFSVPWG